jgi:DNA-binding GntR family transcriptional regulator
MSDPVTGPAKSWRSVPRRMLLADDTYGILREALITNRLTPGQRLNIEQLAQDLNVSITPIRHALVRLEADGFVTREPYKGYVASDLLDRATVAEIFAARIIIETELVAKAAAAATKADIAFLARVAKLDPVERFTEDDDASGGDAALSCDAALHRRIAVIAGNRTMVDILDGLNKRMSAYRSFKNQRVLLGDEWNPRPQDLSATKREHAAIVRAIRQADGDAARAAMRKHLENASRRDIDPLETAR